MRKAFFAFLIIFFVQQANGQKDSLNPSYMAVKPQYGFIIPHSKTIKLLSQTDPYGIEGEYGWFLTREKDWERCNCYSRAGFSMLCVDYDNPSVIGQSYNFIAFVEPLLNYKGNIRASVRMGAGVSYLTQIYDPVTNPQNKFFSTHLSYLVHLDVNLTTFITKDIFLTLYGKYNHISNGGVKKPNLGMNFPTYGLGVGYKFDKLDFPAKTKKPLEKPIPVIPYTGTFFTTRTIHVEDGDELTLSIGSFFKARRSVSRINSLTAGFEGVYDRSLPARKDENAGGLQNTYYSFLIGHSFIFGKFMFSQEWGTYLYAPFYEDRTFFQRYSLTFQFSEKFRAGVTLKAHAEVAENFNVLMTYDLR
jgi:hypothetical protein